MKVMRQLRLFFFPIILCASLKLNAVICSDLLVKCNKYDFAMQMRKRNACGPVCVLNTIQILSEGEALTGKDKGLLVDEILSPRIKREAKPFKFTNSDLISTQLSGIEGNNFDFFFGSFPYGRGVPTPRYYPQFVVTSIITVSKNSL